MKVAVAVDSFKGILSTYEAGNAVSLGIKRVFPQADGSKNLTDTTEQVFRLIHQFYK